MNKTGNKTGAPKFDVTGIGNAIVDVLSFAEESFLRQHDLAKGSMMLVEETRSQALYQQMGPTTACSGGSVANSLAGLASLGAKTAFIGKVKNDQLGSIFTHDMHAVGVHFNTSMLERGPATANCLVYVTPDAQRTMATYIGACSRVSESDIDETLIQNSAITYIEGYLWDTETAKAAIRKAITLARKAEKKIAFTLSDTFCVDRHRAEFLQLIENDIDILFSNELELKSLYQTSDFETAKEDVRGACGIVAVTRSEKGSVVLTARDTETVPTQPVANVVDTTGAGDLYASGFLYGLTRGWELATCAQLGNRCAGEIITQLGARSMKPLHMLVA
jgi:sugar/nucleoside kinase (ribokinase family)